MHGDRPAGHVAGVDPEQLAVGDRRRQHDVGEQRVDDDHVLQRLPLLFGHVVEVEDAVEREHQSVMRAERVEHRAVAARDGRERGLVHGREMVVLREGVDRELPVDRRSPAPSRPAATNVRCPTSRARRPAVPGSAGMSSVASGSSATQRKPAHSAAGSSVNFGSPVELSGNPSLPGTPTRLPSRS